MKKRLIALLLTVVMVCTLLPIAAFADDGDPVEPTPVTYIYIENLDAPREYKKLDYGFAVNTTPGNAVVTDGDYAAEVVWTVYNGYTEQWDVIDDPDYTCKPGKKYMALVFVAPADGYCFNFDGEAEGSKYTGYIGCSGINPESGSIKGVSVDGGMCISVSYNTLWIDNNKRVEYVNFINVPYSYKIGARVDKFTPGSIQVAGPSKEYKHIWYLAKYNTAEELEAVYFADNMIDLALKILPGYTKSDLLDMRKDFGTTFEENYLYMYFEGIVLNENCAFYSSSVCGSLTFTDGWNYAGDTDIDPLSMVNFWPVELELEGVVAPSAPTVSISKTDGKIKLSWNAVPGADKYWIYRSTDGKNFKYYDTTYGTSYTNSSVTSGTKYYYKVKAVNHIDGKDYSSSYSSAKSTIPLTTPKLTVSLSAGSAKLSWNAVTGATKYWIYRSTDGKNFKYYDSTTKTTYTNSSVTADGTYYYKVKAIKTVNGTDWTSDYSAAKSVKILKAPDLSIAKADGKIKLSWNAVDGAAKYWIYRSTDGTNYKYYDTTTKTTYTNSSVTSGTKYYYKVKAANSDSGASVYSSAKSTVPIKTPVLAGELNDGKVKLSWGAVDGAAKYWIYRSTDGENFKYYDSTTKTTYTNSSVTEGTTYYYKIKAAKTVGSTDWASDFSNLISVDR